MQGTHHGSGLDKGSDAFFQNLSGFCRNCTILKADYYLSDKTGNKLTLNDGVYIHHIILMDLTHQTFGVPILAQCPNSNPLTALLSGFTSKIPATLIAKGHEEGAIFYSPPNNTIKSGFWMDKNDIISSNVEAINYKNEPQDVYLAIDYEYLQGMERPTDYLEVGMGMITSSGCKFALDLRMYHHLAIAEFSSIEDFVG